MIMKKMIKTAAFILSLVMVVSLFAGFSSQNAALADGDGPVMAKIKADGKLVVGTEAQYAPYEFKNLKAAMPRSTCPAWTAGMMPSKLISMISSFTPRASAIF